MYWRLCLSSCSFICLLLQENEHVGEVVVEVRVMVMAIFVSQKGGARGFCGLKYKYLDHPP